MREFDTCILSKLNENGKDGLEFRSTNFIVRNILLLTCLGLPVHDHNKT